MVPPQNRRTLAGGSANAGRLILDGVTIHAFSKRRVNSPRTFDDFYGCIRDGLPPTPGTDALRTNELAKTVLK